MSSRSRATSVLPLEIDEIIIAFLAEDDAKHSAVKACSLVCRAFLPLCRKYIFASIVLNDIHSQSPTTRELERLLSTSPEIADYIRKLDYNIVVDDFASSSIQECLKRINRLKSLAIQHYRTLKLDWSSNDLRPALLHLLHLPTLIHFKIKIDKFVASDLVPCVNLKTLEIGRYTNLTATNTFSPTLPDCSIQLNEFISWTRTATAIMDICTAQRPDGQPVIAFSSLAKISVAIEKDRDIKASQELFRRCEQLTDVHISLIIWTPRQIRPTISNIRPNISNMLRPSMQTLRHLHIDTYVDDIYFDPLTSIPSELEDMRNNSVIETIIISILAMGARKCGRNDDWGRLDEVLTRSGWLSLREVTLTIKLSMPRRDDKLDVAFRKLPETQFPRLSTSKSISFKFKVE